jgi:conjugative transfer signal peptidase TraF
MRRGSIIVVCPPENDVARQGARRGYLGPGNCPGGSEPLVKPVAAVAGDLVEVSPAGVSVNGFRVPSSAPLWRDSAGRSLAPLVGVHLIRPGELWLLSGRDARSFDSRYFGPVPLANVRGVARPVLVR